MSKWPSTKARKVRKALARAGWHANPNDVKGGSHQQLLRGESSFTWAFSDSDEIGPKMLARIAKQTGLKLEDL